MPRIAGWQREFEAPVSQRNRSGEFARWVNADRDEVVALSYNEADDAYRVLVNNTTWQNATYDSRAAARDEAYAYMRRFN